MSALAALLIPPLLSDDSDFLPSYMPQSPSSSSRAPRPSPFPYVGSTLRASLHPASRPQSPSPTATDLPIPEKSAQYRQFDNGKGYQSFGLPTASASVPSIDFDFNGAQVYQQPMDHSIIPTPELLGAPFAFKEPSTTPASPLHSGPTSFTSNSPDRSFRDRYDDSPGCDDDNEYELPPGTRETTPPIKAQPKTRRPPNAWILYRSDRIREYNKLGSLASFAASRPTGKKGQPSKGPPQAEISRIIAEQWKKEPKDVKAKYDRLAEIKKIEHQRDYPDYKYQPMKKEEKIKLKEMKDREKALLRKEKALDKAMRPRKPRTKARPSLEKPIPEKSLSGHLVTPRSPSKKANSRKSRKAPTPRTAKGKDRVEGDDNSGFLDGHQVFWGIVPELPNSYVAPELIAPESRVQDASEASGHTAAQMPETGSDPNPQEFWHHSTFPSVPPAEAGLAIDSQSIVPYTFEPAPFPDISAGPTYQSLNSSQSGYHPDHYGPSGPSPLRQEPLPPVEIPGVTESELAEMWGLLEDDTVGADNGGVDSRPIVNWASDPAELVNQWAGLSVPIEDPTSYISPSNFSGSVASQIASEWNNQPYHSLQPEFQRGPHSATMYHHLGTYQDHYAQQHQYPSSRPGYVTIEVPVSSLQQPYPPRPPAYPSVHQGPPLTQATPLSPVNGSFPGVGGWSGNGSDGHPSFSSLAQADGRSGRRSYEYSSPFSTAGLPLDNQSDNPQSSLRTPNYMQSIDGTFESMQSRRVSEVGPLENDNWISPTERMPSFGDFRLPSGNFVAFPEPEFDLPQDQLVEPVHQKPPIKNGRVVAGQHAPPQRVAS